VQEVLGIAYDACVSSNVSGEADKSTELIIFPLRDTYL